MSKLKCIAFSQSTSSFNTCLASLIIISSRIHLLLKYPVQDLHILLDLALPLVFVMLSGWLVEKLSIGNCNSVMQAGHPFFFKYYYYALCPSNNKKNNLQRFLHLLIHYILYSSHFMEFQSSPPHFLVLV